jgi:adenylate cyclase
VRCGVKMERKLTAILSADVKGYSRLMGEDEEATIRTLTAYRAVMTALIRQHRGRVVDSPGDNLLAEFASAVDAVGCAVGVQHELKVRNAELPDRRKMEFRIGINVGDVVVEEERLYGDGVNIAARLEGLAEAGGICISRTVYDHVKNKLTLEYEDLGEQRVKNIAEPVQAYRVREPGAVVSPEGAALRSRPEIPVPGQPQGVAPTVSQPSGVGIPYLPRAATLVVIVMLLVGTGVIARWRLSSSPQATLPFPDKPSVVVLPFVNLSGDPAQEYLNDGITEDLTSDLSRLSGLFVIARNSAFTYKGKAVKVQEVSRELGIRYVVEGSVRKLDDRVRIVAQLVDATTGYQVWSERYDRPLQDLFALQDEIESKIVTTLQLQLTLAEQGVLTHKGTNNLEAYDAYLRGLESYLRRTQEANTQARQLCERAIALDPQYAQAYTLLGRTYLREWLWGWNLDSQTLEHALVLARQAIAVDASLPMAHRLLAYVYLWQKQYDRAITEAEQALALDPNDAEGYETLGEILSFAGRPRDTLGLVEKGLRLNPRQPISLLSIMGHAYFLTGRYDEAIATLKKTLLSNPNHFGAHIFLAITYSELGREEEARAEAAEALRLNPHFSLEVYKQNVPYKDPAAFERWLSGLRKAGLK